MCVCTALSTHYMTSGCMGLMGTCNLACFDSVTPDMEHVLQKVVLAQPDAVQVTIGQVCWCCWCTRKWSSSMSIFPLHPCLSVCLSDSLSVYPESVPSFDNKMVFVLVSVFVSVKMGITRE